MASRWVLEEELSACGEALRFMERGEADTAWTEALAVLDLAAPGKRPGEGAVVSWARVAELLAGVGGAVVVGAAAAGLRRSVSPSVLATLVPLELLVPKVDGPRLRLRLVGRGFAGEAEGRLVGPGGGRVVVRDRLVPAGFGRMPVLVFGENAHAVEVGGIPLLVAAPGASWAAALVRAGIGALAGSRWARLDLTVAALEARELEEAEKDRWRERLRIWGVSRLAAAVEAWVARLEAGGEGGGRLPDFPSGGPSRRQRLAAGMKLQDGAPAALRFAAAQLLGGGSEGWV